MTPFEEELKRALARQEPPAGFTARVLNQVAATKPKPRRWRQWQLAAAAALALMAGGAVYQHHEHEVQGQAAKRKLMVALRIAGSKLQATQQRVYQMESEEATQ